MCKITDFCTGCRACEQSCSQNAISIKTNCEGFLYAVIDESKCISCRVCERICPQNKTVLKQKTEQVFLACSKNFELLKKSTSGGVFATLAKSFLENEGVVYGVRYDKEWNAIHSRIDCIENLLPLLSSKYVQADTGDSYSNVKKDLLNNKQVLYSGTGCQIAGLKSFLKKDYPNLYTIDIVCHGVASPLLFKKFIQWLEKKERGKITFFNFRSKKNGWSSNYEYEYKINGKIKYRSSFDPYYYSFLKGFSFRECCYRCKYSSPDRCGDLTICDFWGVEQEHPNFDNTNGASAILVNSKNGKDLWDANSKNFSFVESSFDKVVKHNYNLQRPTTRNKEIRDKFYENISKDGELWYDRFVSRFRPSVKTRLKSLLPMKLFKTIKKFSKLLEVDKT